MLTSNRVKVNTSRLNDKDVLCLETLQGSVVKTQMVKDYFDLTAVPNGVYVLRVVGKKYTHRLQIFSLKR